MAERTWTDERLDAKMAGIDATFVRIDRTLTRLDASVDGLDARMDALGEEMRALRSDFSALQRTLIQVGFAVAGAATAALFCAVTAVVIAAVS